MKLVQRLPNIRCAAMIVVGFQKMSLYVLLRFSPFVNCDCEYIWICNDSLLFHALQPMNEEFTYLNWNIHRNLTYLPLVPDIFVSEPGQHWFRYWLVGYLAPSHYLNAGSLSNGPLGTNFSEIIIEIQNFIHENASENIVCDMVSILSRDKWAKRVPHPIYIENTHINSEPCWKLKLDMFIFVDS